MKKIHTAPRFLIHALVQAIRHPRTPITYVYCSDCKVRVPLSSSECPKCKKELKENPDVRRESPVPWYGCVILIVLGGAIWGWSAACRISGIDELGRILVYIPLGNLFGMSMQRG